MEQVEKVQKREVELNYASAPKTTNYCSLNDDISFIQ